MKKTESRWYASVYWFAALQWKIIKSYDLVGAGAHKVGKIVAIPLFWECQKDKSYWKRLDLMHLTKYENMYINNTSMGQAIQEWTK